LSPLDDNRIAIITRGRFFGNRKLGLIWQTTKPTKPIVKTRVACEKIMRVETIKKNYV